MTHQEIIEALAEVGRNRRAAAADLQDLHNRAVAEIQAECGKTGHLMKRQTEREDGVWAEVQRCVVCNVVASS